MTLNMGVFLESMRAGIFFCKIDHESLHKCTDELYTFFNIRYANPCKERLLLLVLLNKGYVYTTGALEPIQVL